MKKLTFYFSLLLILSLGCNKLPPEDEDVKLKPSFIKELNGWATVGKCEPCGFSNIDPLGYGYSSIAKVFQHSDGTIDVISISANQKGAGAYAYIDYDQYRSLIKNGETIADYSYSVMETNNKNNNALNALDVKVLGKGKLDFQTWGYKGLFGYEAPGRNHYMVKRETQSGPYKLYWFYLYDEKFSPSLTDSILVTEFGTTSYRKIPIATGAYGELAFTLVSQSFYKDQTQQTESQLAVYGTDKSKKSYELLTLNFEDYIANFSITDFNYFPIDCYYQYGSEELFFNIITSGKIYNFVFNMRTFSLQLKNAYNSIFPTGSLSAINHKFQWIPSKYNTFLAFDIDVQKIAMYENGSVKNIPTPSIDFSKFGNNKSKGNFKYEKQTHTIYMICNGYLFSYKL